MVLSRIFHFAGKLPAGHLSRRVYFRTFSAGEQSLNLESTPSIRKASNFTVHKSSHNDSIETQDAERICKMLSKSTDSNVNTLLNEASVNLSPALIEEVLKKLSNAGVLAFSVFKWAESQNGYKHTTATYNALIESLGKIKQFKLVWSLVEEMKHKKLLLKQ